MEEEGDNILNNVPTLHCPELLTSSALKTILLWTVQFLVNCSISK